jgi:DNA mismatch repair protein MutS
MQQGTTSFVELLQFVYDHDETILTNINPPEIIMDDEHLLLHNNAVVQLNVINSSNNKSLLNILDRCCTSFGSRLFKERLLNPIININAINARLEKIDTILQCTDDISIIRKILSKIIDLDRACRKITIVRFHPMDWVGFYNSLEKIAELFNIKKTLYNLEIKSLEAITTTINIEEASKYLINDIKTSIFVQGYCHDIDKMQAQMDAHHEKLINYAKIIDATVDHSDKEGYFLYTTKKRFATVPQEKKNKLGTDVRSKPISASSSNVRVSSNDIDAISDSLIAMEQKIGALCVSEYKKFLVDFDLQYKDELKKIIDIVAELDVNYVNAYNAKEFGYVKPNICESGAGSSFNIKGLRHCLIERISTNKYITNDIALNQDTNGFLVYGINAAGKSSLMKAIGLNIVMAQAGMYTACESMDLSPFHSIFTRIPDGDDIYKGQSTFVKEMIEVRNILDRCNDKSLILGDEIASGTESTSAVSIVAAAIQMFCKRKASFVFATHLHQLNTIDLDCKSSIRITHLTLDRQLQNGSGNSIYGLKVCESLGLPKEFIDNANAIRKKLEGLNDVLFEGKTSVYNSQVYMDLCSICKKTPAVETHHIIYKKKADKNGFVENGVHKNHASNLQPLCNKCHKQQHSSAKTESIPL